MRSPDKRVPLNRRTFIGSATGAAMIAGVAGTARAAIPSLKTVPSPQASATLLKMARDIYPHDRIPDLYYAKAIETIDQKVSGTDSQSSLLADGVTALDAQANTLFQKPYAEIALEEDRLKVLKAIEATPFFSRVRSEMVTALYNQKEVWTLLGYEGSSYEFGGYLDRGFNDLDWLES